MVYPNNCKDLQSVVVAYGQAGTKIYTKSIRASSLLIFVLRRLFTAPFGQLEKFLFLKNTSSCPKGAVKILTRIFLERQLAGCSWLVQWIFSIEQAVIDSSISISYQQSKTATWGPFKDHLLKLNTTSLPAMSERGYPKNGLN